MGIAIALPNLRALPYNAEDYIEVKFEIIRPFSTNQSLATPWFNQPGMGVQHRITQEMFDKNNKLLKSTIQNLIQKEYIREIK